MKLTYGVLQLVETGSGEMMRATYNILVLVLVLVLVRSR